MQHDMNEVKKQVNDTALAIQALQCRTCDDELQLPAGVHLPATCDDDVAAIEAAVHDDSFRKQLVSWH